MDSEGPGRTPAGRFVLRAGLGAALVLAPGLVWLSIGERGAPPVLLLLGLLPAGLAGALLGWACRGRAAHGERERARGERSRLLTAVAHDLRQPLYAIGLAAQGLARQHLRRTPGPLLAQLNDALEAADTLLDTINTVALLDSGAVQPAPAVFCVQAMLERIDRRHGPLAQARGLRWTVTPSLEHACTDAPLLERMLDNLVSNAVRYTVRGGVLVSCRRRGERLLLQVWDTGPGVDTGDPQGVFGLHFRGEALTETDNGVGLGLPIVQRAAGLLGIELGVRSRVGHGTCFSLRVPVGTPAVRPRG